MVEFRFIAEDILSGVIKTQDLALDDWSYDDTLNRAGALQAGIPLTADDCTEEILDPWRTAIYVERDGRIEWGGILAPPQLSIGAASLSISCFGWLGYWDHRVIRNTVGQPEAGGLSTFKPNNDVTATHVFGTPDSANLWANVTGSYKPNQGIISGAAGDVPAYQANFAVPTGVLTVHPIVSVTLGIGASGLTSPRTLTPQIKVAGNFYNGAAVGLPVNTPTNASYTWTVNPATGVAWIAADVEAFASGNTGGFFTDPNAIGFDTVVSQLYLVVSYGDGFSNFFAATEQFEIFRALVLDAQSQVKFGLNYDLGIDVTWDAPSGVTRDRLEAYRPFNAKNLGEALRQLAATEDGFDFAMTYAMNATTDRIDKAIKLYYPRKGRDTKFIFDYARGERTNVVSRGFADPVEFAWVGDGWGSGNDDTRLKVAYVDETLRGVYPPYDAAPTFSSVIKDGTLDANTQAFFARRNRPKRVPVVRVDPGMFPRWGDTEIGDIVGWRCVDGYGSTPGLVPQRVRITGTKVSADGGYDLVFADPLLAEQET